MTRAVVADDHDVAAAESLVIRGREQGRLTPDEVLRDLSERDGARTAGAPFSGVTGHGRGQRQR